MGILYFSYTTQTEKYSHISEYAVTKLKVAIQAIAGFESDNSYQSFIFYLKKNSQDQNLRKKSYYSPRISKNNHNEFNIVTQLTSKTC